MIQVSSYKHVNCLNFTFSLNSFTVYSRKEKLENTRRAYYTPIPLYLPALKKSCQLELKFLTFSQNFTTPETIPSQIFSTNFTPNLSVFHAQEMLDIFSRFPAFLLSFIAKFPSAPLASFTQPIMCLSIFTNLSQNMTDN